MPTEPRCYTCELGSSNALPTPVGVLANPLATCKACSCWNCGHHGQRDATKALFICVICDATLLQQAAATEAQASGVPAAPQSLPAPFGPDLVGDLIGPQALERFLSRRPSYLRRSEPFPERFVDEIRSHQTAWLPILSRSDPDTERWIGRLLDSASRSDQARAALDLQLAAVWIVWHFGLPPTSVPGALQEIARAVETEELPGPVR